MFKIDGHTHTQYCPHGSGDHVEKMIERALELGIEEYHITEHTPIPERFMKLLEPNAKLRNYLAMPESEVDRYLKEMLALKQKYKNKIKIKVGFEVDYIPTEIIWTKDFLNEYGKHCDTGIISIHYIEGLSDWRCVDYTDDEVTNHLIPKYGSLEAYQRAYYDLVYESILADLGVYKPTRIGHLTLVDKFQKKIGMPKKAAIEESITKLLGLAKRKNYSLDYNHAGLYKPLCGEIYPPQWIVEIAKLLEIPLIYGSDAHGIEDVGRH